MRWAKSRSRLSCVLVRASWLDWISNRLLFAALLTNSAAFTFVAVAAGGLLARGVVCASAGGGGDGSRGVRSEGGGEGRKGFSLSDRPLYGFSNFFPPLKTPKMGEMRMYPATTRLCSKAGAKRIGPAEGRDVPSPSHEP